MDDDDNAVEQSGLVTPSHVAVWVTDGVIQDAINAKPTITGSKGGNAALASLLTALAAMGLIQDNTT
jgi:hypothetical protein